MYKYYFENAYFQNRFKVFINVARLSIEKDQEKLIRAFKDVNTKYPNTKLIILGDGPLKEKLENLIKKLKLKKSVFLLGRISNPYPYLKKADCFVMSSNHEGQGLAMIEALILKKPVISTNFSCAYDVLDSGKYGLIVNNNINCLAEAMKKFISQGLKFNTFKYKEYNEKAMLDFYNII
ncbi:glycosyltransferase [Campylobacter vicugnae]|uniref:glycosyltransferase n=1 Tax=Campylobacter vicugnae TaxID=1660076 RepID=UPI002550C86E|nr:glycosyltransferase [Campylobacter ovis]MDL0105762.1 glycosyltransferase [Campylobacter ovis]MDL0107217.1 glycosyltransferase [Campylobacter ovis]